jgi:predicted metal-dependent phosphoesterase TrpH
MTRKAPLPDLVDLHVHSSASDGAFPPREVVRRAREIGLKAIAITDHDTTAGVAESLAAGEELGLETIPAVEISAEFDNGACHILGYFIEPASAALQEALTAARTGRQARNREILARLAALGMPLAMEDVACQVAGGVVTRAHFAAALIQKGYVRNWEDAFEKYLGRDKPAFVHRQRIESPDAIRAIHAARGLAVLAHPRQLNRDVIETDHWIERLAAQGLDGVETQTPDHSAALGRHYSEAAARLGLVETGGTDWHGRADADIQLGLGSGSMTVHYERVRKMKERLAQRRGSA